MYVLSCYHIFSIWLYRYNSHIFFKKTPIHLIIFIHFSTHFSHNFFPPKKTPKNHLEIHGPVTLQAMMCGMTSKAWGWEGFLRLQGSLGMVENGTLNRKISDSSWKKTSNLTVNHWRCWKNVVTWSCSNFCPPRFWVAFEGAMDVGMRAILVRTGKYRVGDEELCRPAPLAVVDCHLGSNGETLVYGMQ